MRTHIELKSLLAVALLGAMATFSLAAAINPDRGEWEYKVVTGNAVSGEFEQAINRSVKNGWEFVSASSLNDQ